LEVLHLIMFSTSAKVGKYYSDDSLDLELIGSRGVGSNGPFITCRNRFNWLLRLPQFIIISVNRAYFDLFLDPDILPPLLLVFSLEGKEDRSSYWHLSTFYLSSSLSNKLLLTLVSNLFLLNPISGQEKGMIIIDTENLLWWTFWKLNY